MKLKIFGAGICPVTYHRRNQQNGFTLLELLVVISIAVVMAVAAVPVLQTLPANARVQDKVQRLSSQLQLARGEAVRSNRIVYVCAADTTATLSVSGCNTTPISGTTYGWNEGVLTYADNYYVAGNTAAQYDSGEMVSHILFDNKVDITTDTAQIAFMPTGRSRTGQEVKFKIKDQATGACRTVLMDASGRARTCKSGESNCDAC